MRTGRTGSLAVAPPLKTHFLSAGTESIPHIGGHIDFAQMVGGVSMTEKRWAASEAGAIQAVETFMAALNAGDNKALLDTMHVPHVRISGDGVAVYATREDLEKNYLKEFAARAGESWHHTVLDWTQALHSSEDKVHVFIQWTRYDKDGGLLATHKSLWIMTKLHGRWGAQARSSFAP